MSDTESQACRWMPRLTDLQLSKHPFPVPKAAIKQAIREEELMFEAGSAIEQHGADHPRTVAAYSRFRAESGAALRAYATSVTTRLGIHQKTLLRTPLTPLPTTAAQLVTMPTTSSWLPGSQMLQSHPGNQIAALQLHALTLADKRHRTALPEILYGSTVVSAIERAMLDTRRYIATGVYYKDCIAVRLDGLSGNEAGRLSVDAARWLAPISLALAWVSSNSTHPASLMPWQRSLLTGLLSDHYRIESRGMVHSSPQVKVVVDEGRAIMLLHQSILDRLARSVGIKSFPAKANGPIVRRAASF